MAQNIFVFPDEDVIVAVPARYQGHNVIVERKQIGKGLPFTRTVINFKVYYIDNVGQEVAVTQFHPRMEIWVGYQGGEEGLALSYWDKAKSPPDRREDMNERKIIHSHQDVANQAYIGYGYVERTEWPADPNVGWG